MPSAAGEKFRIVCLGGSAGSLCAFTEILRNLPDDTGMAFVVASHRSPEHAHLLLQILARATAMPVVEVEEGMLLESNRVFVLPPRTEMTVKGDHFSLQPLRKARGVPITIDLFLLSLADAYGRRAVAVILSGGADDGCAALRAIHAAGGLAFAQSDAVFDSMPLHAMKTGYIDFVLRPAEIAKALLDLTAAPRG
jgi:two-component system CheB/CheR fusion protein